MSGEMAKNPLLGLYDACCIACAALDSQTVFDAPENQLAVKQYRRRDRSGIKAQTQRTYKLDEQIVARKRHKAEGQTEDSPNEWYLKAVSKHGRKDSRCDAKPSYGLERPTWYSNVSCFMPDAVLMQNGKRHMLRGQQSQGRRHTIHVRGHAAGCRPRIRIGLHNHISEHRTGLFVRKEKRRFLSHLPPDGA